jgi:hypothetical protein
VSGHNVGRFGTRFDLDSRALRDWTRSKSWEEVTPGAPTGAAAPKPAILEQSTPTGEARGPRRQGVCYWSKAKLALLFFRILSANFAAIDREKSEKNYCARS